MKFFQAVKEAAFAAKLFATAGLSEFFATALKANDEAALKTHLDQAIAAAKGELSAEEKNALDEAVAENATLSAKLSEIEGKLATAQASVAQLAALNSQLSAAGIKFEKPEDFKAAFDARISTKARELVAATGGPIIEDSPAASAATEKAGKKELSYAEFSAMSPAAKQAFFRAGGRLLDVATAGQN